MSPLEKSEVSFRLFDPEEEVQVVDRRLPHWSQSGTLCFITFRTWDSIPRNVLEAWLEERQQWLEQHNITLSQVGTDQRLHQLLEQLEPSLQHEFHRRFSTRWNQELDNCHGSCVLRRPELAQIVADGLSFFDGERYELMDFVIMPNHVHLLAAFSENRQMLAQCESWKRYTATQLNQRLNRKGRFWQQDGFDHLVRSEEQFHYLRRYIAENPMKANLGTGHYLHESKKLPCP